MLLSGVHTQEKHLETSLQLQACEKEGTEERLLSACDDLHLRNEILQLTQVLSSSSRSQSFFTGRHE